VAGNIIAVIIVIIISIISIISIIILISSRVVVVVPGVDEIIVLAANLNKK
jgi:hypothetical protein